MFRGGKNLTLRTGHVLLATGDDKDGFFTAHWCLDIGIRLCSEGLDLAACNQIKKKERSAHSYLAQYNSMFLC